MDSSIDTEDRGYTYDLVGNRKTLTENGITFYYCYQAEDCDAAPAGNRLINIRQDGPTGALYRQFQYDAAGRILQKQDGSGTPLYTVTYNGKGRANEVNGSRYAYDANDHRIEKDGTLYHLEGEHLEATYTPGGTLLTRYLRGVVVDEIVNGFHHHSEDLNDRTNYTFHHDHLNSVTALTGHAGTTEETTQFDAFGAPLVLDVPGTGNDLLYTGREYDRDTELYYYRARYYDPEVGRFISEDPLGFDSGDTNFYAYVGNNPINTNDPSGNVAGCVFAPTACAAGAGAVTSVIIGGVIRGLTGGDILDASAIATDAALGVAGGGVVSQVNRLTQIVRSSRNAPGFLGNIGQKASGVPKNTQPIPSITQSTKSGTRIPDGLNNTKLGSIDEVKNVAQQGLTKQLLVVSHFISPAIAQIIL